MKKLRDILKKTANPDEYNRILANAQNATKRPGTEKRPITRKIGGPK